MILEKSALTERTPATQEQLSLRVSLHGVTADIVGPRILRRTAELAFRGYPKASIAAPVDFLISIARVPGKRMTWKVKSEDLGRTGTQGVSSASLWAEWIFISQALKHWTEFVHVHAGLVATPEQSALLVGRSGAGKSTTTVALALAGLDVYTDDVAIVDKQGHRPYSTPRPIKLDTSARRRLRLRGLRVPRGTYLGESIDRTVLPGLPQAEEPGPPVTTAIFFAEERGAKPNIRPLTSAEAVMRLIVQSASETFDDGGPSGPALALINSVQCYELTAGDLDATVETVLKLLR